MSENVLFQVEEEDYRVVFLNTNPSFAREILCQV